MRINLLVFICLFFTFFSGSLKSQTQIDSLKEIYLDTSNQDLKRFNAIRYLVQIYTGQNLDSALKYVYLEEKLCKNFKKEKYYNSCILSKAVIYQYLGFLDSTTYYFDYLYNTINPEDSLVTLRIFNAIGNYHQDMGSTDSAMKYYRLLLNYSMRFDNRIYQGLAYNNLAGTHIMKSYQDSAFIYHDKAYRIRLKINNPTSLAISLAGKASTIDDLHKKITLFKQSIEYDSVPYVFNDLSMAYNKLALSQKNNSYIDSSLTFNLISIRLAQKLGRKKWVADGYLRRSHCFINHSPNSDSGRIYVLKAYRIYRDIKDESGYYNAAQEIAVIYDKKQNPKKCIEFAKVAMASKNINIKDKSSFLIAKNYAFLRDYQKAYEYEIIHEKYAKEYRKHGADALVQKYEMLSKIKLDSLENIKAKELLIKDNLLAKKENQNKNLLITLLVIGLLFVVVFLYLINSRLKIIRDQKVIIEQQHELLNQSHKDITDSINYAKKIQDALMTSSVYMKDILNNSFVFFKPKDVVSGDFYWVHKTLDNVVYFTVADCTGHGVPGAFMSMIGNSLLNEVIIEDKVEEPAKVLNKLRELLVKALKQQGGEAEAKEGMDIALCKLDLDNNIVEYAGAFNPLFHVRDGKLTEYKPDSQPIGVYSGGGAPFTNHKIKLKPKDMLYISSDGYPDQFGGPKGKKFLKRRFVELLLKVSDKPINEQEKTMKSVFENWKGEEDQIDDVCVMGVRV